MAEEGHPAHEPEASSGAGGADPETLTALMRDFARQTEALAVLAGEVEAVMRHLRANGASVDVIAERSGLTYEAAAAVLDGAPLIHAVMHPKT